MRSKIRLKHEADSLEEALGLSNENIAKVIGVLSNIISKSDKTIYLSKLVEEIWNNEELDDREVILALAYIIRLVVEQRSLNITANYIM